jgi:hypothetical protein
VGFEGGIEDPRDFTCFKWNFDHSKLNSTPNSYCLANWWYESMLQARHDKRPHRLIHTTLSNTEDYKLAPSIH